MAQPRVIYDAKPGSPIAVDHAFYDRLAGQTASRALVERWFAALTEKQLRRGVHRSTQELDTAIARYIAVANARPRPFVWTKTADEILSSVARFCHRISNSGH